MKKKKVLKMFLCIMVIIFVVHMILSIWSASIVLKQIQIAQLCYIANCNIGESRNIYEENYFYDSKEKNHKGSTEEQQEIGYTLNDVTKRISYYPLKKVKITRISYLDKEISYLENEDGSIKNINFLNIN